MAILLGLLASISYGAADFLGGMATRRNHVYTVVLLSQLVGLAAYLAAIPALPPGSFTVDAWVWGGLAGLAGSVGIGFLYVGLSRGRISVVAPVTAVIAAVMPVAFGLAVGERPSAMQLGGVALAIASVALVSSAPDRASPRVGEGSVRARVVRTGLPLALASGVGIGVFLIALSRAGEETGPWPLVSARIASIAVFAVLMLQRGAPLRPRRGTAAVVAAAGVLDVAANLLYLLGTREGAVSIVAVLTSLYPATTVVLARVVLDERPGGLQLVGLAGAAAGVVLITVGA